MNQILRVGADRNDHLGTFDVDAWDAARSAGAMQWAVPKRFGGDEVEPLELHDRYEQLARASLATAFVLTQHDGCVAYLAAAGEWFAGELRAVADGRLHLTVAISHLTTSRGGGVKANVDGERVTLDGVAPWCTAADVADKIMVAAGTKGGQVLALVDRDATGVEVPPPPPIVALSATRTGEVRLDGAVGRRIAGPAEGVLGERVGKLPIGQAFLALGHAGGAIDCMRTDTSEGAARAADALDRKLDDLRGRVRRFAGGGSGDGNALRGESIALAQQACLAAVTVHKGAALVNGHPAQRLAREALFLLVWSCPEGVRDCTLAELVS